MKKVKDMGPEFFEEFTIEEIKFLEAWEELYESEEFKKDYYRINLELLQEKSTQDKILDRFRQSTAIFDVVRSSMAVIQLPLNLLTSTLTFFGVFDLFAKKDPYLRLKTTQTSINNSNYQKRVRSNIQDTKEENFYNVSTVNEAVLYD